MDAIGFNVRNVIQSVNAARRETKSEERASRVSECPRLESAP
jgi:hypothetical protein